MIYNSFFSTRPNFAFYPQEVFYIARDHILTFCFSFLQTGFDTFHKPLFVKAFIGYSNNMQDVYKNVDKYNAGKERKVLIVFDDMIADISSNKKLNQRVTELFIRGRKLNISLVFITQSYLTVPKDIRLNSAHLFIKKILNKQELQSIAYNHSLDIGFKSFMNFYKTCTAKPISFLVNNTTLASDNPFRRNFLERI